MFLQREHRKCYGCGVVEDERHAIYDCPAFKGIRQDHVGLIEKYRSVNTILNPDPTDIVEVANFLSKIDKILIKR